VPEDLLRELAPQVLGAVVRHCGDFDAAEDAVKEALLAAARHWPTEGVPDNPRGWLFRTAARRVTDAVRAEQARRRREEAVTRQEIPGAQPEEHDDTLTRAAHALLPEHGEVTGLLALMLLTDARRPARTGPVGELVPLAEQDRTLWDRRSIAEGIRLVATAMSHGAVGEYQLQAAIAALHDGAPRAEDTDWPQILGLYGLLQKLTDNPVVTLNAAVATAMVHGPAAGLAQLEPLDPRLAGNHRLDAVRGHLREKLGETETAAEHYRRAAAHTLSVPERDYLLTKAATLRRAR
jgi:predicted RNA polymerase sigma factor